MTESTLQEKTLKANILNEDKCKSEKQNKQICKMCILNHTEN